MNRNYFMQFAPRDRSPKKPGPGCRFQVPCFGFCFQDFSIDGFFGKVPILIVLKNGPLFFEVT